MDGELEAFPLCIVICAPVVYTVPHGDFYIYLKIMKTNTLKQLRNYTQYYLKAIGGSPVELNEELVT